jgi:tRNA A-37 threonylcarbamoyl transferase component Bud32
VTEATGRLVDVTAGGVRWQLRAEYRDCLVGPHGLRLEEWLSGGQAQVVKHGPHRTVYRVTLPGLDFYLKHFRLRDLRAWLRQLVRPAKARMEFDRALAVAARRIPTVTPLGVGEHEPGPSDSFLVTQSLDGVEPLHTFIETILPGFAPARQARVRRLLAEQLGRLIAHMHNAGIVHHDLHAANLLVRLDPGDRPHLYLIDLHAVRLGQPLRWRASRANLVMLNRWFILRVSRADRLCFWRAYCRQRGSLFEGQSPGAARQAQRELALDLEERTWASNLWFWRNRDRRCLATNRYYERVHGTGTAGYAVRDLDPSIKASLCHDPDEPFRRPGVKLLKDSRSSTVAEFDIPVGGVQRPVIYKRFQVTTWSDPWVALVRTTPALRSWIYGHGLRERCLPTARPLAVLHRRRRGLSWEGYLLTDKITGALDLRHWVDGVAALPPAERRAALCRRIDQVAGLVHALHRRCLSHRDLKAANVLVAGDQVWLIDLVGVTRFRALPRARRVQNLARLHASFIQGSALTRTDKLRFLRTYLQWGLVGPGDWKGWWRQIEQATWAKVRRNGRRGRPLA